MLNGQSKINFQAELEQKLSQLDRRKSQKNLSSSHKKTYQPIVQLDQFSKISPHKLQSSKLSNSKDNSPSLKVQDASIFSTISDSQLEQFLRINFNPKIHQLTMDQFIEKMLTLCRQKIKDQVVELLYQQLARQITTTNPQVISLNALQIALRRKNMNAKGYFQQKLSQCKYQARKNKLKNEFQSKSHHFQELQAKLNNREKQIEIMVEKLKEREQDLTRRQKKMGNKEKQFHERYKNMKKILEDTAFKLEQEQRHKINEQITKLDKKMNTFERNLKYKIDTLQKKMNEIQKLREFKEKQIKLKLKEDLQGSRKQQEQNKKLKQQKHLKQLNSHLQQLKNENQNLQEENHKLLKMCTSLEQKTTKMEKKIKKLQHQNHHHEQKIKQYEFICEEKDKQFSQLDHKLLQLQSKLKGQHPSKYKKIDIQQVVQVYECSSISSSKEVKEVIRTIISLVENKVHCNNLIKSTINHISSLLIELKQQQENNILEENENLVEKFMSGVLPLKKISTKKIIKIQNQQIKLHLLLLFLLICRGEQLKKYTQILINLSQEINLQHKLKSQVALTLVSRELDLENGEVQPICDFMLNLNLTNENSQFLLQYDAYKLVVYQLLKQGVKDKPNINLLQKLSIIVQRLFYHQRKELALKEEWIEMLEGMKEKYKYDKGIIAPNIQSIMSMINQN